MGAAAATQFKCEEEALKAGKTQEDIDAWKKSNAASAVSSSPAIAGASVLYSSELYLFPAFQNIWLHSTMVLQVQWHCNTYTTPRFHNS